MKRIVLAGLFLFIAILSPLAAQPSGVFGGGGGGQAAGSNSGGAYYNMSEGGYTIAVNLWGFVRNPGRYIVPGSTRLVQLISFGGGPSENARMTDIRIIRDPRIDSTIVEKVLVMNLELFQKTADVSQNPPLNPGDTVIVPGNALSTFQLALGIARDVAIVISTVISLVYIARSN